MDKRRAAKLYLLPGTLSTALCPLLAVHFVVELSVGGGLGDQALRTCGLMGARKHAQTGGQNRQRDREACKKRNEWLDG